MKSAEIAAAQAIAMKRLAAALRANREARIIAKAALRAAKAARKA